MRLLSIAILIAAFSATAQAQVSHTLSDSTSTDLSFVPTTYLFPDINLNVTRDVTYNPRLSKTLTTTGWVLKDIILRNKFDGFGFYPHTSMLHPDTYSVTEYNSLYHNYPFPYNR